MKKVLCFAFWLTVLLCAADIPQSIMLESGNIRVRLDGRKRWNMNRIEYCNELLCIDSSNAHYGMTCRPHDFKYAVGSGHEESGFGEKVTSIKIYADDREVSPKKNVVIRGKKLKVEKVSKILSLDVKYDIVIENDVIYEFVEAVSNKDMKLHHLYFFMHPWSPRFSELYIDKKISFKSNNKFPNRKFVPVAAFYDEKSGLGVGTSFRNIKGEKKMMRFIWDRPQYRKDYLCDYFMSDLPRGKVISYEAKTGFFQQLNKEKLQSDIENLFRKLEFK